MLLILKREKMRVLFCLIFGVSNHLWTDSSLQTVRYLSTKLQRLPLQRLRYVTLDSSDVMWRQKRASSLQDLIPVLRLDLYCLIASASRNASFSQLSDRVMILVFCRTALIWSSLVSTSSPQISRKPTISFHARQCRKCLLTALFWSFHACWKVRLNNVDSVFPM